MNAMERERPDLASLVDALPGMIFRGKIHPEWPMTWVSAGALGLTGYTSAEMLENDGLVYNTITLDSDRRAVLGAIARAVETRETYVIEYRIRTKSGGVKWVSEKGAGEYDADGRPVAVQGMIVDVTALKANELALREAEERLRSIFDNTAEGIFQTDSEGRYLKVNAALARIYGYESAQEMMGELTDIQRQLYVDPQRRGQFIERIERRDRVSNFESQVRRRDGAVIWITENARAVRDGEGRLVYYEGTVEDITERRSAEEALAKERKMLRTLIDASPDIIYVKDTTGRYLLSNLAHTRNLGMNEPIEIVGRKPEDFFVPFRAARLAAEDAKILVSGNAVINREEVRIAENNEQRWFLCNKLPLTTPEGNIRGVLSISRDITEHKQTAEQLRQSQKMEAIGRLAGGVAHDFNNILTAILGYTEIVSSNVEDGTELRRDIDEIHAGGLRAAALTQQLLAFSRRQVSVPQALNLNRLISGMRGMFRRLIGEHIEIETVLDPGIGLVKADPHQIEQVILNLVVNARDALGENGRIIIRTGELHLDSISANQKLEVMPGRYVRMAISDNGAGIPAEIIERIFEPFFTTKERGKGTGLGLATCYGIVKQSDGHIFVESKPGFGTTFSVYLPVTADRAERTAPGAAQGGIAGGTESILIVEDDAAVRRLTWTFLKKLGYHVIEAADGVEALALAHEHGESISLVITDVVMPRMGGRQLAEHLADVIPDARILFTSGYNEEEMLTRGIVAEQIPFLPKPYRTEELARRVRALLDEQGTVVLRRAG